MFTITQLHYHQAKILAHLCGLSPSDRYSRFHAIMSDNAIGDYVRRMSLFCRRGEAGFGVFNSTDDIVGFCHVAATADLEVADIAFSVTKEYRNQGVGKALLNRGLVFCKQLGVKRCVITCLASNRAVQHMVRQYGARVSYDHGEASTYIDVVDATIEKQFVDQWESSGI